MNETDLEPEAAAVSETNSDSPSTVLRDERLVVRLRPSEPPGRGTRKALPFAHEIRRLHAAGYTLRAIRKALSEAGVSVSRSTVHREATRPAEPTSLEFARDPAEIGAAAMPKRVHAKGREAPVAPARPTDAGKEILSAFSNGHSGVDVAEAFMATQTTNSLIRSKEQP